MRYCFSISSKLILLMFLFFLVVVGSLFAAKPNENASIKIAPTHEKTINSNEDYEYFSTSPFYSQVTKFLSQQENSSLKITGRIYSYKYKLTNNCNLNKIPAILTDFKSLKDIFYFSISSNSYKKLFQEIYIIKDDSVFKNIKRNPPLPLSSIMPVTAYPHTFTFFQKDNALGESVWQCKLDKKEQNQFLLCYHNITPLKKSAFVAIKPHNLKMAYLITIDNNNEQTTINVDSIVVAKIDNFLSFKNRINNSLASRLHATSAHLITMIQNNAVATNKEDLSY